VVGEEEGRIINEASRDGDRIEREGREGEIWGDEEDRIEWGKGRERRVE